MDYGVIRFFTDKVNLEVPVMMSTMTLSTQSKKIIESIAAPMRTIYNMVWMDGIPIMAMATSPAVSSICKLINWVTHLLSFPY